MIEEMKPCPFCDNDIRILISSSGDNKDPQGKGSRISGQIYCLTKGCIDGLFKVNRYYKFGYQKDSDHHKRLQKEVSDAVAVKWNQRPSPWIKIASDKSNLPEILDTVLVSSLDGSSRIRGTLLSGGKWQNDYGEIIKWKVTQYMPIPPTE